MVVSGVEPVRLRILGVTNNQGPSEPVLGAYAAVLRRVDEDLRHPAAVTTSSLVLS